MSKADKMTSRELGLVLAQQILDVQDLHYGLWESDLPVSLANMPQAQQRYTDLVLGQLERLGHAAGISCVLDIGCGTGNMLEQLITRGYAVDAVNPSPYLNRQVRARLDRLDECNSRLFESTFQEMPITGYRNHYDVLLCSESFQYIPLAGFFEKSPLLLRSGGYVVICDFFKTHEHGDGDVGDRSFSGGHLIDHFHHELDKSQFIKLTDEDLTSKITPNIDLLDDWLMRRLAPAIGSVDRYLQDRYPFSIRMLKWLARRKLARLQYKYMSGHRSAAMFQKYKSYRLMILQQADE